MSGLIVDSFAGGGGASLGIELALGRSPDIAINHDSEALAMHAANHPCTQHLCQSVWKADPLDVTQGRPVQLLWASPDCKHFSKAKGSAPVRREIRDLAWVVVLWAQRVRPAVICLENVEEFRGWGPIDSEGQPIADRMGATFQRWIGALRREGYRVQHRELRACDYGAPTTRKRLFLIARRDGFPIVWPAPTHGRPGSPDVLAGRLLPWRTAAEIIDWSIPCPSIFLTREEGRAIGVNRPLVRSTMARIAAGVRRYVIEAAQPFIVPITHAGGVRVHGIDDPLRTITTARRGEFSLVTAFLAQHNGTRTGAPHPGRQADDPLSTITSTGRQQGIVTAHLLHFRGASPAGARSADAPAPTITSGGVHTAEVRAFLVKYYGQGGQDQACGEPLHTVPTKARFGLVMVEGEPYQIADIGMRMLTPRELFRAQGFPDSYRIEVEHGGRPLTKTSQIRMCGNSVCPQVAAAILRANLGAGQEREAA